MSPGGENRPRRTSTRRRFLAAAAGAALGGVAGCSGVTNQEFEAPFVTLPEAARGELRLAETTRDSATITREVEAIDGEVTITNRFAAYARGPDRGGFSTLLGRYVGRVNGTEGPGPAVVVPGSELGLDGGLVDFIGQDYLGGGLMDFIGQDYLESVDADQLSLVVPEGLRREAAAPISGPFLLGWMTEPVETTATSGAENPRTYAVDAREFFPGLVYDQSFPNRRWMPGGEIPPDLWSPDSTVLVALGDSTPREVFGVPESELPGERLDGGESFTGNNPFLIAAPLSGRVFDAGNGRIRMERAFDPTRYAPAPLGGATYGMGVLSTPNATVADQSVNPLAQLSLSDLLTNDLTRRLLSNVGDAGFDEFAWREGPTEVAVPTGVESADVPDGTEFDEVAILGEAAEAKTFAGVVAGDYPWLVLVNVARAFPGEDYAVVAAGVKRTPVGAAADDWERRLSAGGERALPFNPFLSWIAAGAATSASAFGALEAE